MTLAMGQLVWWSGITNSIREVRERCMRCHQEAPGQLALPAHGTQSPLYLFHLISSDNFFLGGREILFITDSYTDWLTTDITDNYGGNGLVSILKKFCCIYIVPTKLASNGVPQFTAAATQSFLAKYSISHCISSMGNPHINNQADVGVKTLKSMLGEYVSAGSKLTDNAVCTAESQ